ncbi:hypothetical protein CUJ91_32385 (plasmid) [Paraburkholderia graminis]|uniref:hypothetical protein n=1 Tax=Paraburkholderia graminis TaxID=60548 RepID=UPI000DF00045|nr:hypothetical protein [Paraburkholderia graminis]AXF12691.1 hypothetical protein CUJ91_32385 [Paraburkholderia graminis]
MDMRVREPVSHPMPEIAAFVAQLKSAFGEQEINEAIRRGKAGEATFYAAENGHTVGTASPLAANAWQVTEAIRDRHYCAGCHGRCLNQAVACKQWQQREAGKGKL